MFLNQEDYEGLVKALPIRAVCETCQGEMALTVKNADERKILFYLCQDPKCAHNTEPFLFRVL